MLTKSAKLERYYIQLPPKAPAALERHFAEIERADPDAEVSVLLITPPAIVNLRMRRNLDGFALDMIVGWWEWILPRRSIVRARRRCRGRRRSARSSDDPSDPAGVLARRREPDAARAAWSGR